MKKAFTLIELMITMVLGGILLNYTFTYYINFTSELEYIKAKEKLAMESFKFTDIIIRGFKNNTTNIPGLISRKSGVSDTHKFNGHISGEKFEINEETANGQKFAKFIEGNYLYKKINVELMSYAMIKHVDSVNQGGGVYNTIFRVWSDELSIEPDHKNLSMLNPKYKDYIRLVYTK